MTREFVSKLRADVLPAKFASDLFAGLILALMILVIEISIAAIIFAGPLAPFVSQGTGAILFGAFTLCLIVALTSTYRGTVSVPHFAPAAVLFTVGGTVAASMSSASGEAVFATMIVIIALSTLMTALCYLFLGIFRLADFLRFTPYPLVGGFLAGLGWFLSLHGFAIACGITLDWETFPRLLEADMVWRWGSAVVFALGLKIITKFRSHYLILPASVLFAIGLCHAMLSVLGIPLAEARAAGILFLGMPSDASWPPVGPSDLTHVDWGVVFVHLPGVLGVTLIALIGIVLHADAVELVTGAELDMNREFKAEGFASLIAGLGGSSPGCNTAILTLLSQAAGSKTRLTAIVAALVVGAVLFFGNDVPGLIPAPLLGGLVLFVGLNLLSDWLVATRKTLLWTDYGIVVVVSLVSCIFGFLEGVAVGMVAAVVLFVVRFSAVDVIGARFTARTRHSKRTRPAPHRAILRMLGRRVHVYELCGYITFGNASPIGDRLKQTLNADPAPLCLLLDFDAVTGFDVSAAKVVCRTIRAADARGARIVLSAAPAHVRSILRNGLSENEWRGLIFEKDLDRSLERCEDFVIAEWDRLQDGQHDVRATLFGLSVDHALRELDRQARFEALMERLGPWLEDRVYGAGDTIVAQGEKQEGVQLLTEGRAVAREKESGVRTREYGPGDALAVEAVFANHVPEISIAAVEPCRTALMTPSTRRSLERDSLELTADLNRYLVEAVLAHRRRVRHQGAGREPS